MDRAAEDIIVVFYCICLLTVFCAYPLLDGVLSSPFTPFGISSTGSPETSSTNVPEVSTKGSTVSSYSYTTSGYESRTFSIPVDITDPPLVVEYQFTPKNVTRTKTVTSDYGMKETKTIEYEMPSEDSWLRVRLLDGRNNVIDEGGYGRLPGERSGLGNPKGKLSTYDSGECTVEVRFNEMMGKFSL